MASDRLCLNFILFAFLDSSRQERPLQVSELLLFRSQNGLIAKFLGEKLSKNANFVESKLVKTAKIEGVSFGEGFRLDLSGNLGLYP